MRQVSHALCIASGHVIHAPHAEEGREGLRAVLHGSDHGGGANLADHRHQCGDGLVDHGVV